jgi:hypothetical protein
VPPFWGQLMRGAGRQLDAAAPALPDELGRRLPSRARAPLSPAACRSVRIYLMYGLSEAFRSTYLAPEELEHARVDRQGHPGERGAVLDALGAPCAAGRARRARARGPTVALGYWNDPEASARVFRPDPRAPGAARTRGLLRRRRASATQRASLLRRAARSADQEHRLSASAPDEVEELIHARAWCREVAVHGRPDDVSGARSSRTSIPPIRARSRSARCSSTAAAMPAVHGPARRRGARGPAAHGPRARSIARCSRDDARARARERCSPRSVASTSCAGSTRAARRRGPGGSGLRATRTAGRRAECSSRDRHALDGAGELGLQYTPYGGATTARGWWPSSSPSTRAAYDHRGVILTPGAMAALQSRPARAARGGPGRGASCRCRAGSTTRCTCANLGLEWTLRPRGARARCAWPRSLAASAARLGPLRVALLLMKPANPPGLAHGRGRAGRAGASCSRAAAGRRC